MIQAQTLLPPHDFSSRPLHGDTVATFFTAGLAAVPGALVVVGAGAAAAAGFATAAAAGLAGAVTAGTAGFTAVAAGCL